MSNYLTFYLLTLNPNNCKPSNPNDNIEVDNNLSQQHQNLEINLCTA